MSKCYFAVRENNKTFSTRCTTALSNRMGGTTIPRSSALPSDAGLLVHWGYKPSVSLVNAIERNIPFIILDRGYFDPERVNRVSISFNGHHGLSMPVEVDHLPPRQAPKLQPLRPEDYPGQNVLVVGQLPNDASLRRHDIEAWMGRAASVAVNQWKLPAQKRPHPKSLERWEPAPEPLQDAFDKALVVMTFTSTTAVQSIIQGIPTTVAHKASPAWGATDDREAWIHRLAYREYNLLDEKDADACVDYIRLAFDKATDEAAAGIYDVEGLR